MGDSIAGKENEEGLGKAKSMKVTFKQEMNGHHHEAN